VDRHGLLDIFIIEIQFKVVPYTSGQI